MPAKLFSLALLALLVAAAAQEPSAEPEVDPTTAPAAVPVPVPVPVPAPAGANPPNTAVATDGLTGATCTAAGGGCAGARTCIDVDNTHAEGSPLPCEDFSTGCICLPPAPTACTASDGCAAGESCFATDFIAEASLCMSCDGVAKDAFAAAALKLDGVDDAAAACIAPPPPTPAPTDEPDVDVELTASPQPTVTTDAVPVAAPDAAPDAATDAAPDAAPDAAESTEPSPDASAGLEDGDIDDVTDDSAEEESAAEPTPTPVCIAADALTSFASHELVFRSHRMASVLCDGSGSCATGSHMVVHDGTPQTMRAYCKSAGCVSKQMLVNSPRMRRGLRVASRTPGLQFTALAAAHETRLEEIVLKLLVRAAF